MRVMDKVTIKAPMHKFDGQTAVVMRIEETRVYVTCLDESLWLPTNHIALIPRPGADFVQHDIFRVRGTAPNEEVELLWLVDNESAHIRNLSTSRTYDVLIKNMIFVRKPNTALPAAAEPVVQVTAVQVDLPEPEPVFVNESAPISAESFENLSADISASFYPHHVHGGMSSRYGDAATRNVKNHLFYMEEMEKNARFELNRDSGAPYFLVLALAGEVGELANLFKKAWRDGVLDMAAVREEIADVRIYLRHLCAELGVNEDDAAEEKVFVVAKRIEDQLARQDLVIDTTTK